MMRAAILYALLATSVAANPAQTTLPVAAAGAITASPEVNSEFAVETSLRPVARRAVVIPAARWDKHGGKPSWALAIVSSLRSHASVLPQTVPDDIANWCPAYPNASHDQREAFWVGLVSTLAKHESTYRPTAVGGGGLWYGLVQILPATARGYGCKAKSGAALKDPEDNLSCAMRIMAVTVPRDNVVSRGMRGVAADWGPFHSRKKREDMRAWMRKQSYCAGLSASLRPVARPADLQVPDPLPKLAEVRPTARPEGLSAFDEVIEALDRAPGEVPVISTQGSAETPKADG